MPRSCSAPVVGAVLALLLAPQFAAAGPIEWSFRADPDPSMYWGIVSIGTYQATGPEGERTTYYAYANTPEGLMGVGHDSMTDVRVGVLSKQAYNLYTSPPPGANTANPFTWNVWLTDAQSGETGVASFQITASLLTGMPDLSNSEVALSGSGGGAFRLGNNDYSVRFSTGESETGLWVLADVSAAPTATTPEPGTLALAGVGLAAVGLRLRRRG